MVSITCCCPLSFIKLLFFILVSLLNVFRRSFQTADKKNPSIKTPIWNVSFKLHCLTPFALALLKMKASNLTEILCDQYCLRSICSDWKTKTKTKPNGCLVSWRSLSPGRYQTRPPCLSQFLFTKWQGSLEDAPLWAEREKKAAFDITMRKLCRENRDD